MIILSSPSEMFPITYASSPFALSEAVEANGAKAAAEELDLTRTPDPIALGTRHPLSLVREQIIDIFSRVGFTVAEGPEVEDVKSLGLTLNDYCIKTNHTK